MAARIVWVDKSAKQPLFVEDRFEGSLQEACQHLQQFSVENENCMLGQVLEADGRVYATVSKGHLRLAS